MNKKKKNKMKKKYQSKNKNTMVNKVIGTNKLIMIKAYKNKRIDDFLNIL